MADRGSAPTIETVAAAAGVSIATVSRVLNGLPARPETTRRVHQAVAEVGYVPNALGKSLKTSTTSQIAFAVADVGNPVYLAMVRAVQRVLRGHGYRLVLHSTDADPADELAVLRSLGSRQVDGLILCPIRVTEAHLRELRRAPAPVVVIGTLPEGTEVDNVRTDSRTGAELAIRHLAGLGRTRIALVNGPIDTVPGQARGQGYQDGLAAAGLEFDPELVETADFQLESGQAATARLLATADFDAVLGANDLIALGAMNALRAAGRAVPEDVAVVGIDNTDLTSLVWPPLTSVCLGAAERGRLAAELLVERLANRHGPPRWHTVAPRLVERASSIGPGDPRQVQP